MSAEDFMTDMEKKILTQVNASIGKSIVDNLTSYKSPLGELCTTVINRHQSKITEIIDNAVSGLVNSEEFEKEMTNAVRSKIGKLLINNIGGEAEKRINELKASPAARARMTLAIEESVDIVISDKRKSKKK